MSRPLRFLFGIAAVLALSSAGVVSAAAQASEAPPYIPTGMPVVRAMLSLAQVGADDVLYDLGSGDGRIVIAAAQWFGTRGTGYEIVPELVEHSRTAAAGAGVSRLTRFVTEDLFAADLRPASVVTLYLSPEFNLRLRPALLAQLRPGTRVVSHAFHMGDWEPDSVVHVGEGYGAATIFKWVIPADLDGFWRLVLPGTNGGDLYALEFLQRYQRLTGQASRNGRSLNLTEGRLTGNQIRFTLVDGSARRPLRWEFSGEVRDGALTGTFLGPDGRRQPWRATRLAP